MEAIELAPRQSFRLLRWTDTVREVERLDNPGCSHPFHGTGHLWHAHPELELTLITRGSGTRFIGDNIARFHAGDLVLIGSGLPHYWHGLHTYSGQAIQFSLDAAHPLQALAEIRDLHPLREEAERGLQFSGGTLLRARELLLSMPDHGGVGRFARFMLILETLMEAPAEERTQLSRQAFSRLGEPSTSSGVQKAVAHILDHFRSDVRLDDVLHVAGMSRATFARHFKIQTGKTFTQFLNGVRLDFAARQLVETSESVGEIAFSCGFNNLSHFNHLFRHAYRYPPTRFRKTNRLL